MSSRRPKTTHLTLAAALVAISAALAPAPALAIPAFSRKYATSCLTCHAGAFPALNAYGRQFQENGFQLPKGAEEPVREGETLAPGAPWERLLVLEKLPLALRARGSATVQFSAPAGSNGNRVNLSALDRFSLLAGASVFPDISFVAAADIGPQPALPHAAFGFHNLLFGEGALNVRAGKLLLLDFLRPAHRDPTYLGNPGAPVPVGLNPWVLDSSQLGLDVYGRVAHRKLFYEIAVVQGVQGPDGLSDLDAYKDVFAQLQASHETLTVGLLGYFGQTLLVDTARTPALRFTDRFWTAGADVEWAIGKATLFGYALRTVHGDPTGQGYAIGFNSLRAQVDYQLTRELLATLRYDAVLAPASAGIARQLLTGFASYDVLTNLRLSAELVGVLDQPEQSSLRIGLDLAI